MNRNRLIAGSVAAILVLLVLVAGGIRLWRSTPEAPRAGHKTSVMKLGYCSAEAIRPCVVSFSQDGKGNMLVDILVPSSAFPGFYLTISRAGEEYRYECKRMKDSPTHVQCIGKEMFPGELLQFTLVSKKDERVLAEGQFTIIGLMLSTPIVEMSPTPTSPSYPNPFPNP